MWGRVDIYFSTSTFHCTQNVRLSLIGQVLCGMYINIHGLQQDAEVIHFLFSFILSRIELEEAALYWWQQKDNENIYCILRFCLITLDILYVVFFLIYTVSKVSLWVEEKANKNDRNEYISETRKCKTKVTSVTHLHWTSKAEW